MSHLSPKFQDHWFIFPKSLNPPYLHIPLPPPLLISSSSSSSLDAFRAFASRSLLYSTASLCEASLSALYPSRRSISSPSRSRIGWERMASSLRRSASIAIVFLADAIPFDQSSIVATGGGRVIVVPVVATPVVFQDEVPLHRGCLVLILAAVAVAAYAHHGGRVVIVIPLQAGGAVRSIFIRI